eukprot:COSAG05_NODE_13350_length_433_cov_1.383234_1_plen_80_part_10
MDAIETAICPIGNCMADHPTYNPESLIFDISAIDWDMDSGVWASRVGDVSTTGIGGDVIKEVVDGTLGVRIDSYHEKFTL